MKTGLIVALALLQGLCWTVTARGQFGGAFGGGFGSGSEDYEFDGTWKFGDESEWHARHYAHDSIMIQGVAEIRVPAEEIGIVLAVTSDEETAEECQEVIATKVAAVRSEWKTLDIPDDKIFEDFIAVLPRYEWREETRDSMEVRVQKHEGYRMQTNVHVSVPNEDEAKAAILAAFQHGVTEIVTFNYWNSNLNDHKQKVRETALAAARRKADLLLGVFENRPPAINVEEKSAVFFPVSLYRTYENVLEEEEMSGRGYEGKPRIKAYRPKTTFFNGLEAESDVRPKEMALRPEIAVVATVRLYYLSPASKSGKEAMAKEFADQ